MLEWYRADRDSGADYRQLFDDCAHFLRLAAEAAGAEQLQFRGLSCDPYATPEVMTVAQAFSEFAGIDLLTTIAGGEGDRGRLAAQATGKIRLADDDTWSDIVSRILVEKIEPQLGMGRPTLLTEYPIARAFLDARVHRIYGGTNEIMRDLVSRQIVGKR